MSLLHKIIFASYCTALLCLSQESLSDERRAIPIYLPVDTPRLETQAAVLDQLLVSTDLNQFKIQTIKSWSLFQLAIRNAKQGVFLAAPHYSAWAVRKLNFIPLLRIEQPLKYVLAARRDDSHIFELNDLKNRSVCTQKPLNLDYLMVNHVFKNTLQGASIISVESPYREMQSDSPQCNGFAINEHRFVQLVMQFPDKFIRLHQSVVLNNYSFVAHPSIDQASLKDLRAFLVSDQAKPALSAILSQFAQRPKLTAVKFDDYSQREYSPLLPYW